MNAKKCDRCGQYYTINDLPPYIPVIDPNFRAGCTIDLCNDCIELFYDWLYTSYYFTEQSKKGFGTPSCKQSCGHCRHFMDINEKRKKRECEFGKKWRDVDEICEKWEPKTNEKEVI